MPSTVIAKMDYDPTRQILTIHFVSGLTYLYKQVPEAEYLALKSSGAKGIYLNKHIKGKYAFERL